MKQKKVEKSLKTTRRFWCINWWCCWNSKTWNKKQEGGFLGAILKALAVSMVQPMISSLIKGISGRGVRKTGTGYMDKYF